MARGKWINFGRAEEKVIEYLATNPTKNITEIKEGVGHRFHSSIAKATHNLVDKGIITEFDTYRVKGRAVSRWGLTGDGVMHAIANKYDVDNALRRYVEFYPKLEDVIKIDKLLSEASDRKWKRDRSDIISKMIRLLNAIRDVKLESNHINVYSSMGILSEWINNNIKSERKRRQLFKYIQEASPSSVKNFKDMHRIN